MRPVFSMLVIIVLVCAACTQGESPPVEITPSDVADPAADPAADTAPSASLPPTVRRLLEEAGARSYGQRGDSAGGIQDLYLGYDAEDAIVVGIAVRSTKTYKEAITIVAVTSGDEGYTVSAAEIPDLESFHGKSQELTAEALAKVQGTVLADAEAARGIVDAVSGATQYYKAILVSYALMSQVVIEEIQAQPDWSRIDLQP